MVSTHIRPRRNATRQRWAGLCALTLLLLYPWSNSLAFIGNFSFIDGLVIALLGVVLVTPKLLGDAVELFGHTHYGWAALVLTALFSLSLLQTQDIADGGAKVAQLTFSWLVLVPVVASLLYESKDPLHLAVRVSTIYVCLFMLGWALVANVGVEVLVRYSGTRRLFARFDGMVFWWMPVVALALVRLGSGERLRLLDGTLVLLSLLVVLGNASRALGAALGVAVVYTAVLSFRARRGRAVRLFVSMFVLGLLTVLFLNLETLQSYGLSNRYGQTGILEDSARSYMFEQAMDAWLASGTSFLFGVGLKFEVMGQGIHNVFLQTALFAGVIGLVGILVLLAAPILTAGRVVRSHLEHRRLVHFIRLNLAMLFPWFMTHPMQASRWYWVYFAMLMGLALRARLVARSARSAPLRAPSPPVTSPVTSLHSLEAS